MFLARKHVRPLPRLQLCPRPYPHPLPRLHLHPLPGTYPDPLPHPSHLFPHLNLYPRPYITGPNSRMFKMHSLFKKSTQLTTSCDFVFCFCSSLRKFFVFRLLILSYVVQVLFEAFGIWHLVFSIFIRFFYHAGLEICFFDCFLFFDCLDGAQLFVFLLQIFIVQKHRLRRCRVCFLTTGIH